MTSLERSRDIAAAVRAGGGRALIVGGWVRDRLRGHPSKDVDIEVFGLPTDRVRAVLEAAGRVETVGASFQVRKAVPGFPHFARRRSLSRCFCRTRTG